MRLTRIEIENFKGIGLRQRIDLRPITLLFGPNSAGKSTILQALHYLREILERGNVDPDRTIAGGLIDLGGFATLVHNHELDRTVTLKVSLDLADELGDGVDSFHPAFPLNGSADHDSETFQQLPLRYIYGEFDRLNRKFRRPISPSEYFEEYIPTLEDSDYYENSCVSEVSLELSVKWSPFDQSPYLARLAVEINNEKIAAVVSPPTVGRAQITEFNFSHPLLRRAILFDESAEDALEDFLEESPLKDEIIALSREAAADPLSADSDGCSLRIAVETSRGALPSLDRLLNLDIRDPDQKNDYETDRSPRLRDLRVLLSELVLGPARLVREHLKVMTYIGPLREVPNRGHRPQSSPDETRWAHGLAAWDLLYNDRRGDLMKDVNVWLSGEDRLRTTYRLERVEFKEIPVPSAMHQMFARGLNEDDVGELQELYRSLATRTEIALRDFEKGILVAPGDVGVGISQMVPVIVASLRKQDGILGIEQPELHVHPAIQVGMGDLFIKAATSDADKLTAGKTLLIETHSEHIMLRLLRRVREQTEGEVPPEVLGLTPDELSVIYVESSVEGVRFRPLRVSPDGDFADRWPHGFFAERAEELF